MSKYLKKFYHNKQDCTIRIKIVVLGNLTQSQIIIYS